MKKSINLIKNKFAELNAAGIFDKIVCVVDESMAVRRLRDKSGSMLVIAYPSFDRTGGEDKPQYTANMEIWSVCKELTGGITDDKEDDIYDELLDKLNQLIVEMESQAGSGCSLFAGVDFTSISIDPCFRIFGGFHGWYCSFKLVISN